MLKPLTLSLSFAVALGMSSVSMAGPFGHDSGCSTCGIASPQGVAPSPQYAPVASAQSVVGCDTGCAPAPKSCGLKNLFSGLHKPKVYSYEWVLKKKRVWGHKNKGCDTGCTTGCDTGSVVYPSGQGYASPQGYSSPQGYTSPQGYSSPQAYAAPTYGSGQAYGAPQATTGTAPAPAGDEAPPAPEVAPEPAPEAPDAPAPANAPQSSLLFSTPSGN